MLTRKELLRYSRHIRMPEIGEEGQKKLKNAKVLVIGAGGLGCPVLQYLTAAGVGTIGIVDFDVVDETNLHRQILFGTNDVGKPKADIATQKVSDQNPVVDFKIHNVRLAKENALEIIGEYDMVVDGSDNFPTRYLVNDACVMLGKPLIYGSIFKFEGQVSVYNYNDGPTYRCLFPVPPGPADAPNCAEIGVLGVLPGIIGCLQANETIKIITGVGEPLSGKLLVFDALTLSTNILQFSKVSENLNINELVDYEEFCNAKNETVYEVKEISVSELKSKLDDEENIRLLDVREKFEYEICNLGGELIPLGNIEDNIDKIPKDQPVVVICHHGIRSARAINILADKYEFRNLLNLTGGIHAWAEEIDKDMPTY